MNIQTIGLMFKLIIEMIDNEKYQDAKGIANLGLAEINRKD